MLLTITRELSCAAKPAIHTEGASQKMLCVMVVADFEAMPPFGGRSIIVVGTENPMSAELVLVVGSIKIFPRVTKESRGLSTDMREPLVGVGRSCVSGPRPIICSARLALQSVSRGELDAVVIGSSRRRKKAG